MPRYTFDATASDLALASLATVCQRRAAWDADVVALMSAAGTWDAAHVGALKYACEYVAACDRELAARGVAVDTSVATVLATR